ncbi:hypothetical protein OJAV_G00223640 [Oryzias javanicus]|uniref:WWE domain-containing protein n=1 Tax=Oryzias javanicus TaxID=123683 RepID=A0A437C1P6_ORYJA|nr:hypothetical protein OJAV_G00223640 [Oryzias javanicus]
MYTEEEEDYYFGSGGSGKYFEWQLLIKNQWMRIDNDHVIETHYCQPGAKGMTINTTVGKVFIDFDTLETSNEDFRVQRLIVLPPDQTEDVSWYFRDDHLWCEYGSRGPSTSVSSKDIERHFTLYPEGSLRFTVGSNGYSIDFPSMTQTNLKTGLQRKIRRRPKYANSAGFYSPPVLAGSTSLSSEEPKWEFMNEYGKWTEYQKHSSISSADIEVQYQRNPYSQLTFTTKKFKYELDFAAMTQRNLSTNTISAMNNKCFEWQMLVENQWLRIDNDHVIETHYCQPGAKGMTINTNMGQIFIDFDTLETSQEGRQVQRLSLLPPDQTEEVGWYFKDDRLWCEYGSKGSSTLNSSVSSYSIDFSTMTQTNLTTGLQRNIRRRPKLSSSTAGGYSTTVLPGPSQQSVPGFKWEFMGDRGQWTEYQAPICSCDSSAIEREYMLNPQGQFHFTTHKYLYTLDFSRMCQINNIFGTTRAVRRTAGSGVQPGISSGTGLRWQFQDEGIWKDYTQGNQCSVSSQDIELQYQRNPSGTLIFYTRDFSYELNFSAMTQRNLSTNTVRAVRRIQQ